MPETPCDGAVNSGDGSGVVSTGPATQATVTGNNTRASTSARDKISIFLTLPPYCYCVLCPPELVNPISSLSTDCLVASLFTITLPKESKGIDKGNSKKVLEHKLFCSGKKEEAGLYIYIC